MTFDPFGVSRVLRMPSGTCGSRRELVLLNAGLQCGNKCYDGFAASFMHELLVQFNDQKQPHSQAPILFVSQPTGTATMQC